MTFVQPIQVNTVIVIQPGSYNLRIGKASDPFPHTIPHCIARWHKNSNQPRYSDSWLVRKETQHSDLKHQQRHGLKQAEEALLSWPSNLGEYRQPPTSHRQLALYNSSVRGQVTDVFSNYSWTSTEEQQPFLIGEEAIYFHPSDCYSLYWPIRCGRLNIRKGPGGSLTAVLADLETIWGTAIKKHINIQLEDLKNYRAVLLISDVYVHKHVKEMTNLLLERLGFSAVIIHQESVCATFGAGVSCACVIDVGDQKTSVCCVEDGISHRNTRITMEYGGSDITRCFHWLMGRAGFNPPEINIKNIVDGIIMQEIKESYCHLDQHQDGFFAQSIQIKKPQQLIIKYSIKIGDEAILAPLALFFVDMLGLQGSHLIHLQSRSDGDPEDPHDEFYLQQTQSQQQAARLNASRKKESAEQSLPSLDTSLSQFDDGALGQSQLVDEDSCDATDPFSAADSLKERKLEMEEEEQEAEPVLQLMGVDQAILHSISQLAHEEVKKKMYSCILIIGGGLMFPGTQSWLQHRVWSQMPAQYRYTLESMDVITRAKEMDPLLTAWKGASVLSCLDTTQELWIRQTEWKQFSVRLLRERAPFLW